MSIFNPGWRQPETEAAAKKPFYAETMIQMDPNYPGGSAGRFINLGKKVYSLVVQAAISNATPLLMILSLDANPNVDPSTFGQEISTYVELTPGGSFELSKESFIYDVMIDFTATRTRFGVSIEPAKYSVQYFA